MRSIRLLLVGLILGGMVVSAGVASAAGYPFAAIDTSTYPAIVVGKFASGSGQFTQAEADSLVQSITGTVEGLLGTGGGTLVLTPSQLAGYGLGDADSLKSMVKQNYTAWGLYLYIFLDIKKTAEYVSPFGKNIRIDVYVADMASLVNVSANYLYALSIETPAQYVGLLQLLQ